MPVLEGGLVGAAAGEDERQQVKGLLLFHRVEQAIGGCFCR